MADKDSIKVAKEFSSGYGLIFQSVLTSKVNFINIVLFINIVEMFLKLYNQNLSKLNYFQQDLLNIFKDIVLYKQSEVLVFGKLPVSNISKTK